VFQTGVVEKIKTHLLWSIIFFKNCAVYEMMWKNILEPGRLQIRIWCIAIACSLPKSTDTQKM